MSTEALARVLWGTVHPADRARHGSYGEQAERILADPGPLLAALAEAGVLRVEWSPRWEVLKPARRYATEWTETS